MIADDATTAVVVMVDSKDRVVVKVYVPTVMIAGFENVSAMNHRVV